MSVKTPPCNDWGIWEGLEIEGTVDRNEKTLFVRRGDPRKYFKNYKRIWFTKEFRGPKAEAIMIEALQQKKNVAIETDFNELTILEHNESPLTIIFSESRLYPKYSTTILKKGDQVCIGQRFKDEAFEIGKGQAVEPNQYLEDKRIE